MTVDNDAAPDAALGLDAGADGVPVRPDLMSAVDVATHGGAAPRCANYDLLLLKALLRHSRIATQFEIVVITTAQTFNELLRVHTIDIKCVRLSVGVNSSGAI